jgi:tetratricopeptide (TPR) repeat protein
MKKLSVLWAVLQFSFFSLKGQEQVVAQVSSSPLFSSAVSHALVNPSDQLFSDATGMMFVGQNAEAFTLFKKAADHFKSEKRFHEWTGCFAGMAIVLASEGRYHKFLRISKRALRVHKKLNPLDLDAEETLRSNVGMGYRLVGNLKKANKYWPLLLEAKK